MKSNTGSINTRAQDSNNFEVEFSHDEQDRRYMMNAMLFWYPVRNLSITPAFLRQSGQPYTRLAGTKVYGTTDINSDSEAFWVGDFMSGTQKNDSRLPWVKTLDLSVKYNLRLSAKAMLKLSADVYNVLNTTNITGFGVTRSNSNQIQVGTTLVTKSAALLRQFQFGARDVF